MEPEMVICACSYDSDRNPGHATCLRRTQSKHTVWELKNKRSNLQKLIPIMCEKNPTFIFKKFDELDPCHRKYFHLSSLFLSMPKVFLISRLQNLYNSQNFLGSQVSVGMMWMWFDNSLELLFGQSLSHQSTMGPKTHGEVESTHCDMLGLFQNYPLIISFNYNSAIVGNEILIIGSKMPMKSLAVKLPWHLLHFVNLELVQIFAVHL